MNIFTGRIFQSCEQRLLSKHVLIIHFFFFVQKNILLSKHNLFLQCHVLKLIRFLWLTSIFQRMYFRNVICNWIEFIFPVFCRELIFLLHFWSLNNAWKNDLNARRIWIVSRKSFSLYHYRKIIVFRQIELVIRHLQIILKEKFNIYSNYNEIVWFLTWKVR